jgi:carboxypeptidase PM20D1
MKKLLLATLTLVFVLLAIVLIRTFTLRSVQPEPESVTLPEFGSASADKLSRAVTFRTVSHDMELPVDTVEFTGFRHFLAEAYPLIHGTLGKEIFSDLSILYTWEGSNPSLKPVILTAHMDVVPAVETDRWEHLPFSGFNDGTFIWGRGTLDDKGALISIMETVERLLHEGFRPERTIYLGFGHDEEIGGNLGAAVIAAELSARGVEAAFVLDEGLAITRGMVPMVEPPVALIGTGEKGYLSVELRVEMDGGHSSTPERESAVTVLNAALWRIWRNPPKAGIAGPVQDFIRYIGPEMPFHGRAIFANTWLFRGLLLNIYQSSPAGNALVSTTITPTMLGAGLKDNIIPTEAAAVLNARILPGETTADVLAHLERVVSDERVKIVPLEGLSHDPSPVSPVDIPAFATIAATIREVFPEAIVAPTMMVGASDAKHYAVVSPNIYRFVPQFVTDEDLARYHGLNERIRVDEFLRGIGFYYQLIRNLERMPE